MTIDEASTLKDNIDAGTYKELKGARFAYAMARNKVILDRELKIIKESFIVSDKVKEFQIKREEFINTLCRKDEKGQPIIENSKYTFEEDSKKKFNEGISAIVENYKKDIEEHEERLKEFNSLLSLPISFELHKIKIEDFPSEITTEQMEQLMSLVLE